MLPLPRLHPLPAVDGLPGEDGGAPPHEGRGTLAGGVHTTRLLGEGEEEGMGFMKFEM